mmetsp:Transcript_3881/g.5015  ORF Transcript_3881/g.5015 Transcript_3881/m.5015 type:complete len:93 (-) Transcript_3881:54-332(-)
MYWQTQTVSKVNYALRPNRRPDQLYLLDQCLLSYRFSLHLVWIQMTNSKILRYFRYDIGRSKTNLENTLASIYGTQDELTFHPIQNMILSVF